MPSPENLRSQFDSAYSQEYLSGLAPEVAELLYSAFCRGAESQLDVLRSGSGPRAVGLSLSAQEMHGLSFRVEEALAGSKAHLEQFSQQLVQRVRDGFRAMPRELQEMFDDEASLAQRLYLLGQLSFAQLLVSHAATYRADDDFIDHLRSTTFSPLVRALYERPEVSNQELVDSLGECAEGVSRKLRVLREKGITDFRKDGRAVLNFLTPAARMACVGQFDKGQGGH